MKIAVFGLGYVGSVTATLLAEHGHDVVGIDINSVKIDLIARGASPVIEPGLPERLAAAVETGRLRAALEPVAQAWQVAFVCVATPSGAGGKLDTSALRTVLTQIGRQLKGRTDYAVIAVRSTVQPHVISEVVVPALTAASGAPPGRRYGLVVAPEFLREGSAVADFMHPPFTLIGQSDPRAGDVIAQLMSFVDAPLVRMGMREAVMVKYASNAFHALKVAFANEIGLLCAREGMDADAVMKAFCADRKLNISASYLMPRFAFGGSCLPKDLRALTHRTRQLDIDAPLLNAILPSNRTYLEHCIEAVLSTERQRVGILGMSFKAGTDDLRESPMISMIEVLLGKGKQLRIYDAHVRLSHLTGANRDYIDRTIPHIASLMKPTIIEVVASSDLIVIGNADAEFKEVRGLMRADQLLIDFSKAPPAL